MPGDRQVNATDRKKKVKALQKLLGDFIEISYKTISNMETIEDQLKISNSISGYVIDVDDFYIYLGDNPDGYSILVDLEEIGSIQIREDIPEELMTIIRGDDSVH